MSIDPSLHPSGNFQDPGAEVLICTNCHTDRHLMVETIQPPDAKAVGLVSIEYSCGRCDAFYAHDAAVESVARILAKSPCDTGVLKFGSYYIHCGEPMIRGRIKLATLQVPGEGITDAPSVKVPMAVLRCKCGFQMTIPS